MKPGHLIQDCRARKSERAGSTRNAATNIKGSQEESRQPNPFDLLFSSDSEGDEDVKQIRVTVEGSQYRFACVIVEEVPADGVVDKVPRTVRASGKLNVARKRLASVHCAARER